MRTCVCRCGFRTEFSLPFRTEYRRVSPIHRACADVVKCGGCKKELIVEERLQRVYATWGIQRLESGKWHFVLDVTGKPVLFLDEEEAAGAIQALFPAERAAQKAGGIVSIRIQHWSKVREAA